MIKLIILGIICFFWYLGGQKSGRLRDVACPLILGFSLIFFLPGDWLHRIIAGILTVGTAQLIRLGYGSYAEGEKNSLLGNLTKDKQGAIVRLLWGLLVGIITPLALLFMHYIILPSDIAYIVTNMMVNFSVSKFRFNVLAADICVALAFGSLLFYI